MNALDKSLTSIKGLHAVPSLFKTIFFVEIPFAIKLLITKSSRNLGEKPYTVEFLITEIQKFLSANFINSFSVFIFDLAYSVKGLTLELSLTTGFEDLPYMLQLDEKINFFTPAFFASFANLTLVKKLISLVKFLSSSPIGSFDKAAK